MRFSKVSHHVLNFLIVASLVITALWVLPSGVARAADGDGDGVQDNVDPCLSPPVGSCEDADQDNIPNDRDNCKAAYNPDQKNNYGEAAGDACEAESGKRLNGYAEKIVVYQFGGSEVQFYLPNSQKIGAVSILALQNLAASGGSLTITGEGGSTLRITYNGKGEFGVTHTNSGNSATFALSNTALTAAQATTPGTAPTSSTAPGTYAIQRGDTLTKIAKQFGVTVTALVTANKLKNPNAIRVGQVLIIP